MGAIDELRYPKDKVLEKLKENRKEHRAIFEEAVEGYRAESIAQLEKHLDEVKNGKVKKIAVFLPFPEDHTKDYDRIITMLELTGEGEVVLSEDEVASYIMDDWHWKRQFLTANSSYSVTAGASLESYQ